MRRRTAQEPVEIDVLQKKKEELAQFVDRYNNAVSMVTGTVSKPSRQLYKISRICGLSSKKWSESPVNIRARKTYELD